MTSTLPVDASAGPSGSDRRGVRLTHVPALDGIRGLAVIAVLFFHGGFGWARGGYLGVSAFFTLSGYLITNLLVAEHTGRGQIDLATFWKRRVRRLLPASLVTIAAVAVYGALWAPDVQRVGLRGDLLGSLLYSANWRFLAKGTSYADIQSAGALVQHFWSLAIEEQFYVVWPLLTWFVLGRWGTRGLLRVSIALFTSSVAASVVMWDVIGSSTDAIYYGTQTRAAELLAGAIAALVLPMSRAAGRDAVGRRLVIPGAAILAVLLTLWSRVAQADAWQYRGGFALHAVVTVGLIACAVHPSVFGRALAWRPLRAAGLVSYGLYLYHWPVFLIVDEDRVDLGRAPLFALRVAITVTVSVISYSVIEQPVRRGRLISDRRVWAAAPLGMALVGVVVLLATRNPPRVAFANVDPNDASGAVITVAPNPTTPGTGANPGDPTTVATVAPVPAIMIIGDSGMYDAAPALTESFFADGTTSSIDLTFPGVGLTRTDENGVVADWRGEWGRYVDENDPGLSFVMLGAFDLDFIEANGIEAYREVVDDLVELLTRQGGKVVWLSVLPCGSNADEELNALFASLPARYPDQVAYVDTHPVFEGCPVEGLDPSGVEVRIRKPDKWHLCPEGARRFTQFVREAVAGLGWAPPPRAGWEDGQLRIAGRSWRDEPRFDDPPNGCDPP